MTRLRAVLAFVLTLAASGSATSRDGDITQYSGMCDGSAAAALDEHHFVSGEDDDDVLRVYRIGEPDPVGPPVRLTDFLGNGAKPGQEADDADIEAAARVGNRIYWIGSHGAARYGKPRPTRRRFFATQIVEGASPPTVRPAGNVYVRLLEDMIEDPRLKPFGFAEAAKRDSKDKDGLTIEGLAATPDGRLLIGFRTPIVGEKAIVIPLLNAADVIERGDKATFGDPVTLDLGGFGIRSLDRIGETYYIVAGPFGFDGGGVVPNFALYRWAGPGSVPEKVVAQLGEGLRPESLFQLPGDSRLHLLSDDGEAVRNGERCKDLPNARKSFRGWSIPVP